MNITNYSCFYSQEQVKSTLEEKLSMHSHTLGFVLNLNRQEYGAHKETMGSQKPLAVKVEIDHNSLFDIIVEENGRLYARNNHRRIKEKGGAYLHFIPEDVPLLKEIISEWKGESSYFVEEKIEGAIGAGYLGREYILPDETKIWYAKGTPLPEAKIEKLPAYKWKSKGCKYLFNHPYELHYEEGRFNFYLQKRWLIIEDANAAQKFSSYHLNFIVEMLDYLEFTRRNSIDALSSLVDGNARKELERRIKAEKYERKQQAKKAYLEWLKSGGKK